MRGKRRRRRLAVPWCCRFRNQLLDVMGKDWELWVADGGVEEEGDPGGGEEFGVGGALVGGEEEVGVDGVEDGSEECGVGCGEVAGEAVEGEAGGGEG